MDYRPALRQRTGVGEYAHQLASALTRVLDAADELVLFSSSWKDRLAPQAVPGASVVDSRVPVRVLNYAWHRFGWPPVEWLSGRIDVTHALHPLMIPARHAARIVTIHDLYFLDHAEGTAAEIRRDYATLAASHAQRADAVVVNSDHTALQVRERFGVGPDRIFICPPGAPPWTPRTASTRASHVLFIGTLGPRKNVVRLLHAYRALIGRVTGLPPLVLAGRITTGSEAILAELQHPALAGHVRHVGYVSEERREQLFRDASLLVLPSLDEGFGIPVLEAMTMGVPVVAANRGALPGLLGDAGLLIDPEDEAAMTAAIERLLSDSELAARCASRGLERAAHYNWEASARRLVEAYVEAIAHRSGRRA
jgi:glycosyltransferase involved in cell wall biosynthesis